MNPNHAIQDQENARRLAEARRRTLRDFRATFTSDHGKRVLAALRSSTGHGKPAFLRPAGSSGRLDPYAAAFRDGRKSVVDEILDLLGQAEDLTDEDEPTAAAPAPITKGGTGKRTRTKTPKA